MVVERREEGEEAPWPQAPRLAASPRCQAQAASRQAKPQRHHHHHQLLELLRGSALVGAARIREVADPDLLLLGASVTEVRGGAELGSSKGTLAAPDKVYISRHCRPLLKASALFNLST